MSRFTYKCNHTTDKQNNKLNDHTQIMHLRKMYFHIIRSRLEIT